MLCASLLLSLAVSALLLLRPQCDSGLHQSRYKIGDEIFDSLDFSVTPSRSLLVLPSCSRMNYQHQLSRGLMCHDFVIVPTIGRIGHSWLLRHTSPNWFLDTERKVLSLDQRRSPTFLRYLDAEALSFQYGHDLRHDLQRAVQCSRAYLHVKPARLTRKENPVLRRIPTTAATHFPKSESEAICFMKSCIGPPSFPDIPVSTDP